MKLYATGLATHKFTELLKVESKLINNTPIVESYVSLIKHPEDIVLLRNNNKKIFLFPHLNQNKSPEIDIRDYCKFINMNQDIIGEYSVLFIIHDQLQTYRNQLVMRDLGFIDTIPYLGIGNDHNFLDYYLDNYKRLIVGGLVGSQKDAVGRLNNINFKSISVHGHGISSLTMLEGFKWNSCDTELWKKIATDGDVLLNGELLHVSRDSPYIKVTGGHYLTMSVTEQRLITSGVMENEFFMDRFINSSDARAIFNIMALSKIKFKPTINGLAELF